jgi:hypothetical protein
VISMQIKRYVMDNGVELLAVEDEDAITFSGSQTGVHRISADSSDDRIDAHWKGYVQTAARAAGLEKTIRVSKRDERTAAEVAALLPSNYRVTGDVKSWVIVQGIDNAGWTAEGYVIPRLGSSMLHGVIEHSLQERLKEELYA